MKRINLFLLFLALSNVVLLGQERLTKETAWELVKSNLGLMNNDDIDVYRSSSLIGANTLIKTYQDDIKSPNYKSLLFFIDFSPKENWGHPCSYVFVDIEKGRMSKIDAIMPPVLSDMKIIQLSKRSLMGEERLDVNKLKNELRSSTASKLSPNDYAVIISGGIDKDANSIRYWNDCASIYSILRQKYGLPKENIKVIMADGTDPAEDYLLGYKSDDDDDDLRAYKKVYASSPLDLDGDGEADIEYAASKENISKVFDELGATLTSEDNLFVYVTDHGAFTEGKEKESYICLWGRDSNDELLRIYDFEFAEELNKVGAKYISVCMEQCYSGGFIDDLTANNRIIATACRYDEVSWSNVQSRNKYDEFVYHWSAAVLGKYPNGNIANADRNNDGVVSMEEAFIFARDNDDKTSFFFHRDYGWVKETPQYSSIPANLGEYVSLSQNDGLDVSNEFSINVSSEINRQTHKGEIDIKVRGTLGDIYEYELLDANTGIKKYDGIMTKEKFRIEDIPEGSYKLKLKSITKKDIPQKYLFANSRNPQELGLVSWVHHSGDNSTFLVRSAGNSYTYYMNNPGVGSRGIDISGDYLVEIYDYPIYQSAISVNDGDRITVKVTENNSIKYWINDKPRGWERPLSFTPIFAKKEGGRNITEVNSNFEVMYFVNGKDKIKDLCLKGFSLWEKEAYDYFGHIPTYEYEKDILFSSEDRFRNFSLNKQQKTSDKVFCVYQRGSERSCEAILKNISSDENVMLYVFNSFGKLVKQAQMQQFGANAKKILVNLPRSGFYVFKVKTKTESYAQKIYIK